MSTQVRFELDRAAIARMFTSGGQAWVFVTKVTGRVLTRARLYAPVKTGNLRNSLTSTVVSTGRNSVRGEVGTPLAYALPVHDGTRPHVIRARGSKGVLAFDVGGRRVYARAVRHPGTRGRPFLRRALEEETRDLA